MLFDSCFVVFFLVIRNFSISAASGPRCLFTFPSQMRRLFEGGAYSSKYGNLFFVWVVVWKNLCLWLTFWSAPRIETSGLSQNHKSASNRLIVQVWQICWLKTTERVLCACIKKGPVRVFDSWCWPKESRPLGTRMGSSEKILTVDDAISLV